MKKKIFAIIIGIMTMFCVGITVNAETEGYFTYSVLNNEAIIIECAEDVSGAVTIPETLGGYPVTIIDYTAFKDCYNLTDITIPDSVKHISDKAFENCYSLTKIIVPDSVETIGYEAFAGCNSLVEISLPFVGQSRGLNGVYQSVFGYIFRNDYQGGRNVKQCFAPDEYIDSCLPISLRKVTITDATAIPYGAFSGCGMLTDIIIDKEVKYIHHRAFERCVGLYNLTVYSMDARWATGEFMFEESFVELRGYKGSTTEEFADFQGWDFTAIEDETDIGTTTATISEDKIVLFVDTEANAIDEYIYAAIYNSDDELIDNMKIPPVNSCENLTIVFKDNADAAYAKVFVWDCSGNMQPLEAAQKVEIVR